MSAKTFIKGTFILTLTGVVTRLLGFIFKIILSRIIGAEGIGLYQLVLPICGIIYAIGISGFEVAISRLTAKYVAHKNPQKAFSILWISTIYSMILSLILCLIITKNSIWIAQTVFKNKNVAPLIKTVVWSMPFSAIHCMITSFCLGQQKTGFAGLSQLAEQLIRMSSVYFIIKITGKTDASIGVLSLVIGEIGAAVISINYILFATKKREKTPLKLLSHYSKEIRKTALPVSLNKLSLAGIQSIETILIPIMLVKSGLSDINAIKTLGILTGMALPVILFPSTLTNSVALMLLPNVSAITNQPKKLKTSGRYALMFSLIFGFVCIIFMLTLGAKICTIAFKEPAAEKYIKTLTWLCPFIFISTTYKSMLNAIGKSSQILANNMLSEAINILFIILLIPSYGIMAYMYGLLISQCANALLQLGTYNKSVNKLLNNY